MGVCAKTHVTNLMQQRAEGWRVVEANAQHERVGEKADQAL
jgi:hypothetical protein